MSAAPDSGAVLGVDIGYSPTRATGAVCRLSWTGECVSWTIKRFRYIDEERRAVIASIARGDPINCAAFDGPFRAALDTVGVYRAVERILTRQVARHIGKPGPAHVPNGRKLNEATNAAVRDVLDLARIRGATHAGAIHAHAVVEAFPNTFLGAMLPPGHGLAKGRGGRSDRYYKRLSDTGRLDELVSVLLSERCADASFASVTDHDDRAALVCALSALCVAADRYVAVGDDDGRIILPPASFWNADLLCLVRTNCEAENETALIERPQFASSIDAARMKRAGSTASSSSRTS